MIKAFKLGYVGVSGVELSLVRKTHRSRVLEVPRGQWLLVTMQCQTKYIFEFIRFKKGAVRHR